MKARDIMTPSPAVVTPSDEVCKAADIMKYEEVGCVPVISDIVTQRLVGVITDRDITVRCTARRHGVGCQVQEHMTPVPLQTVSPDTDVGHVIAKMLCAHVRRVPVVDLDGTLMGIVSESDILTKLPERLALPLHRMRAAFRPPIARIHLIAGNASTTPERLLMPHNVDDAPSCCLTATR